MKDELEKGLREVSDFDAANAAIKEIGRIQEELLSADCVKHEGTKLAAVVILHGRAIRACGACIERINDGTYEQ